MSAIISLLVVEGASQVCARYKTKWFIGTRDTVWYLAESLTFPALTEPVAKKCFVFAQINEGKVNYCVLHKIQNLVQIGWAQRMV